MELWWENVKKDLKFRVVGIQVNRDKKKAAAPTCKVTKLCQMMTGQLSPQQF